MAMEEPIFFKNWADIGRTALLALVTYTGFIVLLRGSGKRTLAKMNVFDFVFVVALGSILGETILTHGATALKGLTACASLILFQVVLSWVTTRSECMEKVINGEPTLLFYQGRYLEAVMKRERVTYEEIRAAIRAHELTSADEIDAVVLETDGTFSVVRRALGGSRSALVDLAKQEEKVRETNVQSQS
jgi:uncharacterized membrane protein YcaP (DUF421 family)